VGKHDFVGEKLAEAQAIPATYELSQNFPNPFNPATTIHGLPKAGRVTLKIYNLLGAEVATLVEDEQKVAGYHAAIWDGRNKDGRIVASGVYVYRIRAGGFSSTKKLTLVK
jgi:flagellar hook assembly protein FlgD